MVRSVQERAVNYYDMHLSCLPPSLSITKPFYRPTTGIGRVCSQYCEKRPGETMLTSTYTNAVAAPVDGLDGSLEFADGGSASETGEPATVPIWVLGGVVEMGFERCV